MVNGSELDGNREYQGMDDLLQVGDSYGRYHS